ncbi:MAG: hypothetical protein ACT4P1_02570 [Sporichthyaceae bacterium]
MSTPEDLSIETLADYAEGLLGEAETAAVEALLATSPQAQADLDLLTSLTQILKSDEVGAMPAQYAARIDATLAELARTEPVTPVTAPPAAVPAIAPVIDLASRRREVWVGTRRVGSVAASLVLVIGGAAIGVQVLNTESDAPPPSAAESPVEVVNLARYAPTPPPKRAVKGADGSKIDKKTGTVYLKDGRVLYDNGTVAIPGKKGRPNTIVLGPGLTADPAITSKSDVRVRTIQPPRRADPTAEKSKETSTPATPKASAPVTVASSEPSSGSVTTAGEPPSSGPDPYVANTGETYTPDNFAALVRVLLEESGEYAPAGTPGAASDPAQPAQESISETTQNRTSSGALRGSTAMRPVDRGPGSPALQERVRRCATQLGTTAIAGDAGVWKGMAATIVVVPNPESDKQVIGYVFYGECAGPEPITAGNAQWIQPVGKPIAPASAPEPTAPPVGTETVSRSDSA